MGKTPVKIALINTWILIDRSYAFQLIKTIPRHVHETLIMRINRTQPLSVEEWKLLANMIGNEQVIQSILKILEEESAQLFLTKELVMQTGALLIKSMRSISVPQVEVEFPKALNKYAKLMQLQVNTDRTETIPHLLEQVYQFITITNSSLDQIWVERFASICKILNLGLSLDVLTPELLDQFLEKTPVYLVNFIRAHFAALKTSSDT